MGWGRGKGGNDAATSGATGSGYYASEEKTGNTMMDTTAWIINNEFANFVLLNTMAIKYMCMVGYTFMHGCNVFKNCGKDTATSYKCITMMLACTGGGILVPIFLNTIPVTIGIDAYPMAILTSFLLHLYFPILREVVDLSPIFKVRKKHSIQPIFFIFHPKTRQLHDNARQCSYNSHLFAKEQFSQTPSTYTYTLVFMFLL